MIRLVLRGGGPLPANSFGQREKSFLLQAGVPCGGHDSTRTGADLRADRHPCGRSLPRPSSGLGHARLSPRAALAPGGGGGGASPDPFSKPAGGFLTTASAPGTGGGPVCRSAGRNESTPVRSSSRFPQEQTPSIPGRSPNADAANASRPCSLIFTCGAPRWPPFGSTAGSALVSLPP